MRENRIGILIPTYNGGSLLAESVASAAKAGLPPSSYEILVSDNASDDRSAENLPPLDAQGAPITVHRNAQNIGRVENWNRAVELAQEMGFSYVTFLMVGDLIRDASLIVLRDRMIRAGAALGLASYEIVDESLLPLHVARRIHWCARPEEGVPAERFLMQTLSVGAVVFGPLGANLYDLRAASLRFDPADATHTDQYATTIFLRAADRPVVYLDQPTTQWRQRAARFHSTMEFKQRLKGDLALIERACRDASVVPDRKKILCTFIMRIFFHARGNLASVWSDSRYIVRDPTQISWLWMVRLLFRQLIYKTPWRIGR